MKIILYNTRKTLILSIIHKQVDVVVEDTVQRHCMMAITISNVKSIHVQTTKTRYTR